jgi:outer membrane protein assembly factor BamB
MYVLDSGHIMELDEHGGYRRRFPIESTNPARTKSSGNALARDQNGNFYIVDAKYGEVRKYSPQGQLLFTFSEPGTRPGQLENPRKVAVDAEGNCYVVDAHRLLKFDARGQVQWQYRFAGFRFGWPITPLEVETGRDGRLFVLKSNQKLIELNAATGDSLTTILEGPDEGGGPYAGAFARDQAGNFYLRSGANRAIEKYSPQGQYLGGLGEAFLILRASRRWWQTR